MIATITRLRAADAALMTIPVDSLELMEKEMCISQ